jgi:hypothetical protein
MRSVPRFATRECPASPAGDVAVENERVEGGGGRSFFKARMRVRDAGRERRCQTSESGGHAKARAIALNFLSKTFLLVAI